MEPLERIPPQSREAEVCVLGAMILDPGTIPDCEAMLTSTDFYNPAHGHIFHALSRMVAAGVAVDLVTLKERLTTDGKLDAVGGVDYLVDLVEGTPGAANLEYYAGIVKTKSLQRSVITLCQGALREAYEPIESATELLGSIEEKLFAISHGRSGLELVRLVDAAQAVLAKADQMAQGMIAPGVMTGLGAIDDACGGMREGEVIVLAGDTGSGKTTLADTIGFNIACAGGKVLVVSVEMLADERAKRYLQVMSQVSGTRIRTPKRLGDVDWEKLHAAVGAMHGMPLMIHPGAATTAQVVSQARRAASKMEGLDLVIIDYLQLLTATREQGRSRAEQVSRMAWAIKMDLSMGLSVPVLLLSQLTRSGLKEHRPPSKHDLKESGDIENHANAIWLLHRPDPEKEECPWSEVWFCQDKHRDMPSTPWRGMAAIRLEWERSTTTFKGSRRVLL